MGDGTETGSSPILTAASTAAAARSQLAVSAAWIRQIGWSGPISAPNRLAFADTDPMVDFVLRTPPPAAQIDQRHADGAGIHGDDAAGTLGKTGPDDRCLHQMAIGPLEEIGGAAKGRHHAGEHLRRTAGAERRLDPVGRFLRRLDDAAGDQHLPY